MHSKAKNSNETSVEMDSFDDNGERSNSQAFYEADTGSAEIKSAGSAPASSLDGAASAEKYQVPEYLRVIGLDPRQFWPKKYRFTREKSPGKYNPLNIAERNFYEANGYIIIDDCVSQKLLTAIVNQHTEFNSVDELLLDKLLIKNTKLVQYVKCFCDEMVMLMTSQLVESFQTDEQARALIDNQQQQRQQLFRDWLYLPFRPIDRVVCALTAIEPLEHVILLVPGTHRIGQCSITSSSIQEDSSQLENPGPPEARQLFECASEKLSTLVDKSKKGFKYINLKPGQTLFYHPGLIHGFTDDLVNFNKRQLASIAYFAAADCEYVDLSNAEGFMEKNAPVPINLAHFGTSNPCDYTVWFDKPRLVQDTKSNL